jgi:hypothetical protein
MKVQANSIGGIRYAEPRPITKHARTAADIMWKLMEAGILSASRTRVSIQKSATSLDLRHVAVQPGRAGSP